MLAHAGGWDEILMVVGPIAIFAWLLWIAQRRAKSMAELGDTETTGAGPDGSVTPGS